MRCLVYYEPSGRTRQEQRQASRICGLKYLLGDGFAYNSIGFAKSEMRDFAKHLRREGWRTEGSMRQGYYEAFRGRKHRFLYVRPVD